VVELYGSDRLDMDDADNREAYWARYYANVAEIGHPWLDYGNGRVQAQSLALTLEALGDPSGLSCLDVGCGVGELCKCLADLGARDVTGIDLTPKLIQDARATRSDIRWICGSPSKAGLLDALGTFDLVSMVEVLQYLTAEYVLAEVWAQLARGGRIAGVVPNRDCPIVQNKLSQFEGQYVPLGEDQLTDALSALPNVETIAIRGLAFTEDQRVNPYEVTAWGAAASHPVVPNRLQFVALK
jgi:2-polyprenyl-3-methyl-5-hydroxy-6-metoxy-1,4-benzoquinol methylase